MNAPFWAWAIVSVLLGLGFTFFSGAVEAWLVDALRRPATRAASRPSWAAAQIVGGVAMLAGSVLGGVIAQVTNLGVPFLMRGGMLLVMFVVAALLMRDLGFTPDRSDGPLRATRSSSRVDQHGLGIRRCAGSCSPPVHRRRRHLRLLRAAAIPAGAVG